MDNRIRPKRPYRKPRISQIRLSPDEAILTYCKKSSGGSLGSGANKCLEKSSCKSIGGS